MTDDATLSTPPAPDAVKVKRYVPYLRHDAYIDSDSAEMRDATGSVQETHYVLASDYDSLARQVAGLRALLNEVREIVPHEKGDLICRRCRIDEALAGDQP